MIKIVQYLLLCSSMLFALNNDDFPFDKTKIKGYSKTTDIKTIVAPIINQVWIASKQLSYDELKIFVLSKYKFKIIGYKRVYGLLIEIDETSKEQLDILKEMKQNDKIDNIYNRVYEGTKGFDLIKNY